MKTFVRKHASAILQTDSQPASRFDMALCGLATCMPLMYGAARGQILASIYGALTGYLLGLNIPLGTTAQRLRTLSFTCLILVAGFTTGSLLREQPFAFQIVLLVCTYWLGLLANEGAELERGMLFSILALAVGYSTKVVPTTDVFDMGESMLVAYLTLCLGIPLLERLMGATALPSVNLISYFRKFHTREPFKQLHAISYALAAWFSIWFCEHAQIERGYWATVTVLLVMKPDRIQAIYRIFQRLVGTCLGVLLVDLLIQWSNRSEVFILLAIACAAAVPWAIKRNYGIVAFFATLLVILLIELASPQPGMDIHTPFVRFQATAIGCLVSIFGVVISKALDLAMARKCKFKVKSGEA